MDKNDGNMEQAFKRLKEHEELVFSTFSKERKEEEFGEVTVTLDKTYASYKKHNPVFWAYSSIRVGGVDASGKTPHEAVDFVLSLPLKEK